MKHIRLLVILTILSTLWSSCDNELDLTAPWKDIPIVYGMLSPSDTAQYIRVERGFIDKDKSPLEFTKNPDSIYYKNATVQIKNLATDETYMLTRVDANLEGFARDTGIWAQSPNYVYKIKTVDISLSEGVDYQLIINKGDRLPETKVTTQLVGSPFLLTPLPNTKVDFNGKKYIVVWKEAAGAKVYDIGVTLHYKENTADNPNQFVAKKITWKPVVGINPIATGSGNKKKSFESKRFFHFLKEHLPVKNVNRKFVSIDILVIAGGKEIKKYFSVNAANTGLTGSEVSTSYTNIPDGAGIFSSLSKYTQTDLELTDSTLDSLKSGYLTKELNFIN